MQDSNNSKTMESGTFECRPARRWPACCMRIMFYSLLVMVAVVFGAWFFFKSDAGQDAVKRVSVRALEKAYPIHVKIEKMTWDHLSGLSIRGVCLSGKSGFMLEADQISTGYSVPLLLKKTLFIRHITFSGCRIYLAKDPGGLWNFENLFRKNGKESSDRAGGMGFDLIIGRISVDRSHIVLREKERIRHFHNVGFDASLRFKPSIEIKVDRLTFQTDTPDFHLTGLSGGIHYDPRQKKILFENLSASTEKSKIKVNGSITAINPESELQLSIEILALSTAETAQWASLGWMRPASIMGSVEINGTPKSLALRSILRMASLSIQSQGGLRVTGDGGVSISGSAAVRNLNFSELPLSLPAEIVGTVNADIVVNGENLMNSGRKISVDMDMHASRLFGIDIRAAAMALKYEQDRLTIEQGRLDGPLGSFDFSGVLDWPVLPHRPKTLSVKLASKKLNPQVLTGSEKTAGEMNFDLTAEARTLDPSNPESLSAEVSMRLYPSKFAGIALQTGRLRALYADRRIRFDQAEVSAPFGRITWNGYIAPGLRDCRLQVSLKTLLPAAASMLSRYISGLKAPDPMTGQLNLELELTGWYDAPVLKCALQGADLHCGRFASKHMLLTGGWQGIPTDFSSRFELLLDRGGVGEIAFSTIQIKGGLSRERASVEIRGGFENEEGFFLSADIEKWLEYQKYVKIYKADFGYSGWTLRADEPIRLTVTPDEVSLTAFRLISEKAELSISGSLTKTGSQNLYLSLKNFRINRIEDFFPAMGQVQGKLSLHAVIKGSLTDPVIDARACVEDVNLPRFSSFRFDLSGSYAGSKLYFRSAAFVEDDQVLESSGQLRGRIGFMPPALEWQPETFEADLIVRRIHLSRLPLPAVQGLTYDGIITGKASIRSDGESPILDGGLSLEKGDVSFSMPDVSFKEVSGNIRFSGNRVYLEKFKAKGDKQGSLDLSGTLTADGIFPSFFDVRLKGKNLFIPYEKAIYAVIEPDMRLSGNLTSPVLAGKILVTEARADLDAWVERGPSDIKVINSKNHDAERFYLPEKETERRVPFFSPVAADVALTIANNAWIRGQGLDAEIKGKVNLKKTPQKSFTLVGSLNAVRGVYVLQGKRFKITEGRVSFIGLEETNPDFDLIGVYRIKNIDILAKITGTAQNLILSLGSDPEMDQADIISYLVFGQPADGLNSRQAFDAEKAAMNLTGALSEAKLDEIFKKYFDIDIFYLEMEEGDVERSYASFGKYIAPNVFVLYRQGFSYEAGQQLEVSYELSSRFSLQALIGDEKQSGIDLIWKYDF